MADLCTDDALEDVASYNWLWLFGFVVTKCIGIVFVLCLEVKSWCCDHKDAADEDAKTSEKCCNCCRNCTKECAISAVLFSLRLLFILFGTIATFVCIWVLKWTDRVSSGYCRALDDKDLVEACNTVQYSECTYNGDENFYNVMWANLTFTAPYIVTLVSNVLGSVLWVVRLAVFRYGVNKTHMADV